MHLILDSFKRDLLAFFSLLLIASLITLQSLYSPISGTGMFGDSAVFLYIGQQINNGHVPYVDYFDHKGPLLYLINAFGLKITSGNTIGIWFLELVSMFLSLIYSYKIVRLIINSRVLALLAVLVSSEFLFGGYFGTGGFCEEWALPFIAYSMYVFTKSLIKKDYSILSYLFVGICFAAIIAIRLNMAIVWVVFVPAIVVDTLFLHKKKGRFWVLFKSAFSFLIGMCIIFIPVFLWLSRCDAVGQMLSDYLGKNISYVKDSGFFIPMIKTIGFFIRYSPLKSLIIIIYVIVCVKDFEKLRYKYLHVVNIIYIGLTLVLISISGRDYAHYGMIMQTCLVLPSAYILQRLSEILNISDERKKIVIATLCLLVCCNSLEQLLHTYRDIHMSKDVRRPVIDYLKNNSTDNDRIFVMRNDAFFYFATGIQPSTRYIFVPSFFDPSSEIVSSLERNPPKYIIDDTRFAKTPIGAKLLHHIDNWEIKGRYKKTPLDVFNIYELK